MALPNGTPSVYQKILVLVTVIVNIMKHFLQTSPLKPHNGRGEKIADTRKTDRVIERKGHRNLAGSFRKSNKFLIFISKYCCKSYIGTVKTADLYIRVSTDEQAEKGYSQRNQEELLKKYCGLNNIVIRNIIFEDHSAKTFNRPKWKLLLQSLKKYKRKTDLVLFLKWDRFSRNAGDAYQMINILRKLGVEPQAIEQPLDLSIPENKIMLAFYLAAPEVENDRRALNVLHGMRRARKEGRYLGKPPYGYINKVTEDGKKYIATLEPAATIVREAYLEVIKGIYHTEQIYEQAKRKGFPSSKSVFWYVLRNPLYCGKVFISQYKDEENTYVKGQHEPIISEYLFYQAQDALNGRKRGLYLTGVRDRPSLILRGFVTCPECGKILSGSLSKGRSKYYAYYHCFNGCNFRFKADELNNQLYDTLTDFFPRPEILDIYKIALEDTWKGQTAHFSKQKSNIEQKIKAHEEQLSYVHELLMSRKIEPGEFRTMKETLDIKIRKLQNDADGLKSEKTDISELFNVGLTNLLKLDYSFSVSDIEKQRLIIRTMFPEQMLIENGLLRTGRVNEAAHYIYLINNNLLPKKNGQIIKKNDLSNWVIPSGFEPETY
jgi:site-specific DNA recombinase